MTAWEGKGKFFRCKFCNGRAGIIRGSGSIHEEPVCRKFRELSKEAFELIHADAERIEPPSWFLLEDVTGKCPEEGSPN